MVYVEATKQLNGMSCWCKAWSGETEWRTYRSVPAGHGDFADITDPRVGSIKDGRIRVLGTNDFDQFHHLPVRAGRVASVSSTLPIDRVPHSLLEKHVTTKSFLSEPTCTGLKKCTPTKRSNRPLNWAISIMDKLDVLEAKMVSGLQRAPNSV